MSKFKPGDRVIVTTKRYGKEQYLGFGEVVEEVNYHGWVEVQFDHKSRYYPGSSGTNDYLAEDLTPLNIYNSKLYKLLNDDN